ncbi:hypothetical protein MSAN_00122200 [Mycena sanguinolenta]|uniref:Uncharacterized protein n=1 Tax=Mycena sanguinolenta TaxID=230812 RepID=A0A8H6ZHM1_9AGAR|nr:hypothetical protein MSAN_00122200 [Mycena sanguinolenta]
MDDQPQLEPEYTHSSTGEPGSSSHASGMFSHSQHFTVTGGTFTNITKNYAAPSLPSDFRMIPMGDIDLRHEIRLDNFMVVVGHRRKQERVRRLYSAKVEGRKSTLTVAIYQGEDAEQEWRSDLAKYIHPNIVQIWGTASSNSIHATLFNDDLILPRPFMDRYRGSHFMTVYIYAHLVCNFSASCAPSHLPGKYQDFSEVANYILSEFQRVASWEWTIWIRHSNGRLCTELAACNDNFSLHWYSTETPVLPGLYSLTADAKTIRMVVDSLTLEQYHRICDLNLRQRRRFYLSASTTVNLGAVFRCSSYPLEDSVEIAFSFSPSAEALRLCDWRTFKGSTGEVMPNGWTRFLSGDVFNNTLHLAFVIFLDRHTWLSQANHIFRRLNIMSRFEDYGTTSAPGFQNNGRSPFGLPISLSHGPPPNWLILILSASLLRILVP